MSILFAYCIQSIIMNIGFYIISVFFNTSYDSDEIFFKKYLLKRTSKLNILFLGKKCNYLHPHSLVMAIVYLIIIFTIFYIIILTILLTNLGVNVNQSSKIVFLFIYFFIPIFIDILCVSIKNVVLYSCMKKTKNLSKKEKQEIRQWCINEWPDFFTF